MSEPGTEDPKTKERTSGHSEGASDDTREGEKETARVEAFSDGVFAIAITLLILEVKVPRDQEHGGLAYALLSEWPIWMAFLTSFMSIGIMWLNHHRLFSLIRRSDDGLLIYNGLLLLAVTIVPFPTAVVAEYISTDEARIAATFYSMHGLVISLCYTLLWRHAAKGHRLLGRFITAADAEDIWRQYRFGPLLYIVCICASQWNAYLGVGLNLALALFFAMPPKILRKQLDKRVDLDRDSVPVTPGKS